VVQQEDLAITRAEAPALRAKAEPNGGMQVQGWDKNGYSVSLCKAVAPASDAQQLLSEAKLSFHSGELTVTGLPHDREMSTYLLIRVPKAATLDLSAVNGPLGVYGVDGTVKGRVTNGPVSAEGCTGDIDIAAENGPVSSEGNSGHLHLHAQNGPVSVALQGESWRGSGLEAHAENGPLTLQIPHGYKSGVLVESDGNGPVACASICSEAHRTSSDTERRIEFGSGPTLVHLSVVNGPLAVN
jgi:hypothetical protein